jgi:hypothetical protein
MIEDILKYVIAGFIGWILKGCLEHSFNRKNTKTYLTMTISNYIKVSKDNAKIINRYWDKSKINVGSKIKLSPRHIADNLDAINGVRIQAIQYLKKSELVKLTSFSFVLQDIETQTEGFCKHLKEHQEKK